MTEIAKENTRESYYKQRREMGKKEFTLMKMQEYGFWPENLPTPYERQKNETKEDYKRRKELIKEYERLSEKIAAIYKDQQEINYKLKQLKKDYSNTWDSEIIRKEIAKDIMKESIKRREAKKALLEQQKKQRKEAWEKRKKENIVYIGKGYSSKLSQKETNITQLNKYGLPVIQDDKELGDFLEIDYSLLRVLTYHRDVIYTENYNHFEIPKKSGGMRTISEPKPNLKKAQKKILTDLLEKLTIPTQAHGFIKGRSVVTGASVHSTKPELLINIDLENFFPTITFSRVRGLFMSFGYSGYISSLLAMLCTECERMPIEIKDKIYYTKISERLLPQGAPSSPMITNYICSRLDKRLDGLAHTYGFTYTRYADDMSFSLPDKKEINLGSFLYYITNIVVEEGFSINQKKTRILRKNNRQSITGIVLNGEEIGIARKWVKNFRALLHHAKLQLENQGTLSDETRNQISGRIAWLQCVNAERYQSLIQQGLALIQK